MKKLLVLAVAMLFGSSVFAAPLIYTATADFTQSGTATLSFQLKKISDGSSASSLSWGNDAFNTTETVSWVKANEYAEVTANITKTNASVYMYTDNRTDLAQTIPNLQPSHWTDNNEVEHYSYGGLVRTLGQGEAKGGDYRGYVSLLFSYNTTTNSNITSNGTEVIEKNGTGANAPVLRADRFVADKSNEGYDADADATIASLGGPTFGVDAETGAWSGACTNNTAYMYFFGGFKQIIGGDSYTTKLHIVSSWE